MQVAITSAKNIDYKIWNCSAKMCMSGFIAIHVFMLTSISPILISQSTVLMIHFVFLALVNKLIMFEYLAVFSFHLEFMTLKFYFICEHFV